MTDQTRQRSRPLVPWVNSGSLRSLLYLVRLQRSPLLSLPSLVFLQSPPLLNLPSLVLLQFLPLLVLLSLPLLYLYINRSWLSKAMEATEERESDQPETTRYTLYTKMLRVDQLVGLEDLVSSLPLVRTTAATLRSLLHQWCHLYTYRLRNGSSTLLRI